MISVQAKRTALKAFSEGKTGWRETADAIGVSNAEDVMRELRQAGFKPFEPTPQESAAKMTALNSLLDDFGDGSDSGDA